MGAQRAPDSAADRLSRLAERTWFLPAAQRRFARDDRPLPIGHGSTNSQPSTVAAMLDLLDVGPGQRILDVGAGSGWTTCLLAALTGPQGSVLGLEVDERVAAFGAQNVARWAAEHAGDVATVRYARATPGVLGAPDRAPYDRILVSAMADRVPPELIRQLSPGGIMVVPAAGRMAKVRRSPGPPASEHRAAHPPKPARREGGGEDTGRHESDDTPAHTVELAGWYRFVPLR